MMRNAERATRATRRAGLLHVAWFLVIVCLAGPGPLWAGGPGTWGPMPDMPSARAGHTATLLLDGNVLIAGGKDASRQALSSTELFNPATGAYHRVGDLAAPVWGHTATPLQDGTVLIAGGRDSSGQPVASAQVYDPGTTLFTALTMNSPRAGHTTTRLADGRVLVAGGSDGSNALAGLEIYDPNSKAFSPAPNSLLAARQSHTATLLGDGRVLLVGGSNASGVLASVEIFNPADGTVTAAGSLSVARTLASAARLLDGTVLVAGGQDGGAQDLNTAEIFDPAKNTFALLSVQMSTARSGHIGLMLENNGKVLIAGGTSAGQLVTTVEVYDPVLGAFWQPGSPAVARQLFGANFFLVPYTGILIASGGLDSNNAALASSEAFFYPTIRSYKPDYQPGDTVVLMGERWLPSETISINIHESNTDPDINVDVVTDTSGTFTVNAFQVNQGDLQQRFLTTASGQASHWTAQTGFTDGGAFDYSPNSQSLTANAGGAPVSFSQTVTAPKNNGSFTASLQVAGTGTNPIPAAWVSTSPGILSFTTTSIAGDSKSWTVSFAVPNGTTAGTYTANIKANPSIGGVGVGQGTAVTLTVFACTAPSITSNPTNQAVEYGQNASFSAAASGDPTPTVQWQVSTDGGTNWSNISGATSTTLTVTAPTVAQSGNKYRAVFTNSCGGTTTATTTAATLTVNKATPTFSNLAPSATITYGTSSITVSGTIGAGTVYPPTTENVAITINGTPVTAAIGANGAFSASFDTHLIPAAPSTPYTITYSYPGDTNFNSASDASKTLTVNKASPTFSNLTASQTITYGTASINLSGKIAAGTVIPAGQAVKATINGVDSAPATIGGDGSFSITYDTHAIPAAPSTPYTITYSYAGDTNFNSASDTSTSLTVNKATLTVKADDKTMILNGPMPTFTASYSGFKNNETLATSGVAGSPSLTTGANGSAVGSYTINAALGSLTAINYSFTFVNGTLLVQYASTGLCLGSPGHQILQPINADGTSVFKQKSTVPAKFRVCDANGNSVGTLGVVALFRLIQTVAGTVVDVVDEAVDSTTPDAAFRWDSTSQQWIFNMNTTKLSANVTYHYRITLNDWTYIDYQFGLK